MSRNKSFAYAIVAMAVNLLSVSACVCPQDMPSTVASSIVAYPAAVKVSIGNEVSANTTPCQAGTFCPGNSFRDRYFAGFVDIAFKGGNSRGNIVIKNRGFCGAEIEKETDMLLFGTISKELVDGYVGRVPVFTPASCAANQDWGSITEDDQTSILDFQEAS